MTTDATPLPEPSLPDAGARDRDAAGASAAPLTLPQALGGSRVRGVRRRFTVGFAAGLLAVLAVGAGALYAFEQQYDGRVLPGVRVGSVDLSGLTPTAARDRLLATYGKLSSGSLVLTAGDVRTEVGYDDVGRRLDVDGLVAEAMAIGHAGSPIERVVGDARTAFRGVTISPRLVFDMNALTARIDAAAARADLAPVDAAVKATKTGFTVTAAVEGRTADRAAPLASAAAGVGALDGPSKLEIAIPVSAVEPAISAAEATTVREAAERIAADLVVSEGSDKWTIKAATIRGLIAFRPTVVGGYTTILDVAKVKSAVSALAKSVNHKAVEASFLVGKDNKVVGVTASKSGRALDVEKTSASVLAALQARSAGTTAAPVSAVVRTTTPNLTTDEAKSAAPLMVRISTWTTYFPYGNHNNFGANIWLPARFIDGTVVAPGATFDFWKAVGPVTRERGFGLGGAIINGHTEPEGALAGGICSCSTTLFNAAMRAGFDMGARKNHFYYIDRYPLGLDATVFKSGSGSTQTMSWTNDTKYPVLIRGSGWRVGLRGYVRFDLYSVPNGRKVVISAPTVRNIRPSSDDVRYTSSLKAGTRQRVEYPVTGKDVWRTVTVYENGRVINSRVYYSHYARINGLLLIGTG